MRVLLLLGLSSAALIACSNGATGSSFGAAGTSPSEIPAGTFGGVCVAGVDDAIGARDLGSACGMSYGGRGTALSVRAPLAALAVRLGDSGQLPASGGSLERDVLDVDVAGIVEANVLRGSTSSAGSESLADASVAGVRVGIAGVAITAGVLQSNAKASCADASGGSIVADLRINDLTIQVTGEPNQTIAVGPVRVVINEQVESSGSIVVHALHVSAAGLADVAIASSRASVVCPCGTSSVPTNGSASGGTSGGSTSGTGTSSGSSSGTSGGSSGGTSDGLTSGTSGSDGDDRGPSDFGQVGDACDDANGCFPGNRCVPSTPSIVR